MSSVLYNLFLFDCFFFMNLKSMAFNVIFSLNIFYREFQEHGVGLNGAQFKQLLVSALKDLFGEVWN